MAWDNSIFDAAFDAAGMREAVVYLTGGTPPPEFHARFDRPQRVMLDGEVHTTEYSIEFTTADAPALKYRDLLLIGGVRYRVRQELVAQGDGHWTVAELEEWPEGMS